MGPFKLYVTLFWPILESFLKTFAVKFSSKIDKKMTRDIWVDPPPPPVSYGDTVATPSLP